MKKIFGAKQHKELDKLTCIAQKISSYELMERAVNELFVQLCADILCLNNFEYHIFAGTGNNGGDGLGLARKLINENCNVRVWFCNYSNNIAEECKTNLELLQSTDNNCVTVLNEGNLPKIDFPYNAVIIDAIFGAGLNRAVGGNYAEVIRLINNTSAKVISIDLPSGLFVEDNSHNDGEIVCADMTYKIGNFPLAAMFAENSKYFGRIKTIDIGYDATTEECLFADYKYLEEEDLNSLFKLRGAFDHKGSFGHGLLIAGSYGKAGAAIMSARAALRSGIGL